MGLGQVRVRYTPVSLEVATLIWRTWIIMMTWIQTWIFWISNSACQCDNSGSLALAAGLNLSSSTDHRHGYYHWVMVLATLSIARHGNLNLKSHCGGGPARGLVSDPMPAQSRQVRVTGQGLTAEWLTSLTLTRYSSRPRAGRSTDIPRQVRIECSAVYTLRCLYMARITSRENNKRFVSHGFCHRARPSLRFSGTRRFVVCFGSERWLPAQWVPPRAPGRPGPISAGKFW